MKVAIAGYGNIGKAVEKSISLFPDISLFAVFTRRDPKTVGKTKSTVLPFSSLNNFENEIDVVINCMGSKEDLPLTTALIAEKFNVIDSFDTHKKIPKHFETVDKAAKKSGTAALISCGWDPGIFSLMRLLMRSCLPKGKDYTFWGKGVSQGHSDAVRRIFDVVDAKEYTEPIESAVYKVKSGAMPELSDREMHKRNCFVVCADGADTERIEREIKEMPDYFEGYDTRVNFLDYESFLMEHKGNPHKGRVLRYENDEGKISSMEFSLELFSNPDFTAKVLLCYSRALYKLWKQGERGSFTVFDIKPKDLLFLTEEDMLKIL